MKISLTRISVQNADQPCWICGEALWHEPTPRWDRALQEYVTDAYQHAFRLRSENGLWSRVICDTCSYTDAEALKEHFHTEAARKPRQN